MNDIDLCTGDSCPIKSSCLRHILYQRALKESDGTEYHWHVKPSYMVVDAIKLAFGKVSMNPFDCSEALEELLNKVGHEIH